MALIPDEFIHEILAATDLVELIGEGLALKKTGGEYQACCPFHEEKTPSFTVSPRKQFYHCFGCGAHGNAIGWLVERGHDFREAVEVLARRLGKDIPRAPETEAQKAQRRQRAAIVDVLGEADRLYRQALRQSDEAKSYLRDTRGLSGEVAARFRLGWASPDALRASGVDDASLVAAGLLVRRDDGSTYERLRNRVTFPIRDPAGRVVGFGGRLIGDGKPKYLNTPETAAFQKGRLLYGLYEYHTDQDGDRELLIVEGYLDVIQLAEADISAAATLGTAVTPAQLQAAYRFTDSLLFMFDGDAAGEKAAWRALEAALPLQDGQRSARFVTLPDGKDPDDLVRELGQAEFRAWLDANAVPLSEKLIGGLAKREAAAPDSLEGRARLVGAAAPWLATVPDGVFKDMLIEEARRAWSCKLKTLQEAIAQEGRQNASNTRSGDPSPVRDGAARASPQPPPRRDESDPLYFDLDVLLRCYILIYGTETAFDERSRCIVSLAALRAAASRDTVEAWLEHPRRRIVARDGVVFDPTRTADPQKTVNLFRGFEIEPRPGDCSKLLRLLHYLCGESDNIFDWVLKWTAYPLQYPGAKMRTAVIMHGGEGTGKNTWWGAVREIYGEYGAIISQQELESQFTGWASGKLFIIGNEVVSRQEMYHQSGRLRNMITEPEWSINEKHLPSRMEANHCNLVFLANAHQPATPNPDDRRYLVVWTPPKLDKAIYKAVGDELAANGVRALYDYLLQLPLDEFNEWTEPPMTQAKEDLIEASMDSHERFWRQWRKGELPIAYRPCKSMDAYRAYRKWCDERGERAPAREAVFLSAMGKRLPKRVERYLDSSDTRQATFLVPVDDDLDDFCRQRDGQSKPAWLSEQLEHFRQELQGWTGQN